MSTKNSSFMEKLNRWNAKSAFSEKIRAATYSDIASFTEAGIPPFAAIGGILEVHRLRKNPLLPMTETWHKGMESGLGLADVMAEWVTPSEVTMIQSGEKSGSLAKALRSASELIVAQKQMMSETRKTLIAPVIYISALFSIMYFMMNNMSPAITRLVPKEFMPSFAASYFAFGDIFIALMPWVTAAFIVLSMLIFFTLSAWTGSMRSRADKLFPWTIYRAMQSSYFLITLAAMMRSGVPMKEALGQIQAHATPWVRVHVEAMIERLGKGRKEAAAIDTGMILDAMSDRLLIYSRLPDFTSVMESLGRDAVVELRASLAVITGSINMGVILITAAFIVSTLFSMMEVGFAVSDAVSQRH